MRKCLFAFCFHENIDKRTTAKNTENFYDVVVVVVVGDVKESRNFLRKISQMSSPFPSTDKIREI